MWTLWQYHNKADGSCFPRESVEIPSRHAKIAAREYERLQEYVARSGLRGGVSVSLDGVAVRVAIERGRLVAIAPKCGIGSFGYRADSVGSIYDASSGTHQLAGVKSDDS